MRSSSKLRKAGGLLILCWICLASSPALAGPPFLTDDPEPVEPQHFEFYAASQYSSDSSGHSLTLPHFELNYGAAPNVQVHLIAPMSLSVTSGIPAAYGFGDTEAGVKFRFVQESKSRPQVGVFPLIELQTGSVSRGLGSGQTSIFLPVWLQKSYGPWMTYGGGGYWHNPGTGNRDYWFGGWLLQRTVSSRLAVGAELFCSSASTVGGRSCAGSNVGLIYDIDSGHHLLFSAGDDIRGSGRGMAYAAYQWTWGPKEKNAESK